MRVLTGVLLGLLPLVPRSIMRFIAWRYIAGERLDELLVVVKQLHEAGLLATVDVLGENSRTEAAVRESVDEYLRLVDALSATGIPSEVSIKPTLFGIRLSDELAERAVSAVVRRAAERRIGVTIDMEDSTVTDATLRLYEKLRGEHDRLGVAIQAYLHRSMADVERLLPLKPVVRVCKGIYVESPALALQDRQAIRENYLGIVTRLVEGGGYPAIATHDPWLVDRCLGLLRARAVGPTSHEFQMLLGVGEALRPRIRAQGSPLRLYCPYGPDWHAYSVRRLKENPRLFGYAARSLVSWRTFQRSHVR